MNRKQGITSLRGVFAACAVVSVVMSVAACGDAPPPPAQDARPSTVRVHVANGSRFDICRIEACGVAGRAVDTGGPTPGNPPLKPHTASLYEVPRCPTRPLVAVACPDPGAPQPPCLKAEGGNVDEGTMFRVSACAL